MLEEFKSVLDESIKVSTNAAKHISNKIEESVIPQTQKIYKNTFKKDEDMIRIIIDDFIEKNITVDIDETNKKFIFKDGNQEYMILKYNENNQFSSLFPINEITFSLSEYFKTIDFNQMLNIIEIEYDKTDILTYDEFKSKCQELDLYVNIDNDENVVVSALQSAMKLVVIPLNRQYEFNNINITNNILSQDKKRKLFKLTTQFAQTHPSKRKGANYSVDSFYLSDDAKKATFDTIKKVEKYVGNIKKSLKVREVENNDNSI